MGGSTPYGWTFEQAQAHGDDHYSFRMIRMTVLEDYEAVIDD